MSSSEQSLVLISFAMFPCRGEWCICTEWRHISREIGRVARKTRGGPVTTYEQRNAAWERRLLNCVPPVYLVSRRSTLNFLLIREGNCQFILMTGYLINWTQRLDSPPGLDAHNKKAFRKFDITRWRCFFGPTSKPRQSTAVFPGLSWCFDLKLPLCRSARWPIKKLGQCLSKFCPDQLAVKGE